MGFEGDTDYDVQDEFKEFLDGICRIFPIESGEVRCMEKGGVHWRFIYKDNEWKMQRGTVVYEDI